PGDTAAASQWFSAFLEQPITVRYSPEGFPDDNIANGPTIVSMATLQAVSELFDGMDVDETRQRFRTTLEIDGVLAFWEDQLFGEEERSAVRFRIGEVNFEGSNPCARCPVPPRNPRTGEIIPGFQKRLSDFRRPNRPGRTLSFGAILLRPRNLAQTMPRLILATRRLDLIHMRWPLYGFGASLSSRGHQAGVCGAGALFNPAQTMFAQ